MTAGKIFSVGHGALSQTGFAEQMHRIQVSYVIDVRSVPYSRYQEHFCRDQLATMLKSRNIGYLFMGDLLGGRPDDDSCYTDGRVDYSKTSKKDFFLRGISRLRDAHMKGYSVCLLCSEGKPTECHRAKLIGVALENIGISVQHVLPSGALCSQSDVMAELKNGQLSLFDSPLLSRKVYR